MISQEDCAEPLSLPDWNWSSVYPNWWWTCHHKHHCNDTPHECFYCWRDRGRPDSPTPQDLIAFELARRRLKQSAILKPGRLGFKITKYWLKHRLCFSVIDAPESCGLYCKTCHYFVCWQLYVGSPTTSDVRFMGIGGTNLRQ